jgi:phospholipase D1/2
MGSANINDRSQKGDGDSEIALVVEDTDEIESTMNGEPVCPMLDLCKVNLIA